MASLQSSSLIEARKQNQPIALKDAEAPLPCSLPYQHSLSPLQGITLKTRRQQLPGQICSDYSATLCSTNNLKGPWCLGNTWDQLEIKLSSHRKADRAWFFLGCDLFKFELKTNIENNGNKQTNKSPGLLATVSSFLV